LAAWDCGAGVSSPQPESMVVEKSAIQSRVINCFTGKSSDFLGFRATARLFCCGQQILADTYSIASSGTASFQF
jgi:hypothetical protein